MVEARDDVDVDTTDDGGPALVRVRIEGHSIDPTPDRELTVTLPDKQYEQLEAGLAVGTLKVEGVDAKTLSVAAAAGEAEVSGVQAEQLELSSAAGKVILRDTWAQKAEVAAAAGSLQLEGVEADELSVSSAVGGASLKQVTAGDLEIGSALGSIQLEDVWADSYTKAGIIPAHQRPDPEAVRTAGPPHPPQGAGPFAARIPYNEKSRPADMCGWTGHIQGNLAPRVCEAARPSARFGVKFCPQGNIRGKEFLSRDCAQKWVPPKSLDIIRR